MYKILTWFIISVSLFAMPKFLMPDEAFIPKATLNANMQIEAKLNLAKGIYVYADKVKFEINKDSDISIKNIKYPKSVEHFEELVYLKSPQFLIDLKNNTKENGIKKFNLTIYYQGCSEQGLCYEPLSKTFEFSIDSSKLTTQQMQKNQELSDVDIIADTIKNSNIFIILATFFGFGFLLSLTPCVFPMIPIISGLIISQGRGITTQKAFFLSVVYVLAMAVAYTIAGVLAGLFGANLQATLQNPYVVYSFSAIFVALAMSIFGYYELKLPDSFVSKISKSTHGSGVVGIAVMGFLSALIVGPCVAAPLAGALVYIGQTGDAILGGMALFSMGIGMGVPLIIVGVSAGKFMPRPGAWMTIVSAVFGVMMLLVAIWMLEKVADVYVIMLLYSFVGIGFAIYLGVFQNDKHLFQKTLSVILFIYSVVLFLGALGGSTSLTKPLSFAKIQKTELQNNTKEHIRVTSIQELDKQLKKHKGKKIILDFTAKWCSACKELEDVTFSNVEVIKAMQDYTMIKADITQNLQPQKDLSAMYGVFGPPVILFIDENSQVQHSKTIVGFVEPDVFLKYLQ